MQENEVELVEETYANVYYFSDGRTIITPWYNNILDFRDIKEDPDEEIWIVDYRISSFVVDSLMSKYLQTKKFGKWYFVYIKKNKLGNYYIPNVLSFSYTNRPKSAWDIIFPKDEKGNDITVKNKFTLKETLRGFIKELQVDEGKIVLLAYAINEVKVRNMAMGYLNGTFKP